MSGKRIANAMKYEFIAPNKKQIIIGLILSYIYIFSRRHVAGLLTHIPAISNPDDLGHHLTVLVRTTVLVIFFILLRGNILQFLKDFKDSKFKDNFKWIMKGIVYYYLFRVVFVALLFLIRVLLHIDTTILFDGDSINQSSLDEVIAAFPIYNIHLILLAPIGEEIVCRYILFHSFRNKGGAFAIILSSLIFGLCHVTGEFAQGMYWVGLYHLIHYMIPGLANALIYERRRNLTHCMVLHIMHNLISELIG